ncbi:hypothetical protein B0T25DRAFT_515973 [Lasiosphaeria hispida]|uniref:Secreted protein n=1 Tax=Lasiosphaeria hispida TaxID=260671 RepID=A0AAJ0MIX9_9PEZI|nr:hypothetical protein B0T25DRAFT_515973 [Lasiosphaeria hispida]
MRALILLHLLIFLLAGFAGPHLLRREHCPWPDWTCCPATLGGDAAISSSAPASSCPASLGGDATTSSSAPVSAPPSPSCCVCAVSVSVTEKNGRRLVGSLAWEAAAAA